MSQNYQTGKKPLANFYEEYSTWLSGVGVGSFYRNYTLEFDPEHQNRAAEYRQIEFLHGMGGAHTRLHEMNSFRFKLFQGLREVGDYFAGEFTETHEGDQLYEDFHHIWRRFFQEFYFKEVYVAWGDKIRNLEVESWKDRDDIVPEKCEEDSKFRLFRLISNKKDELGRRLFASVYTGIEYYIDEQEIPLVRASFNEGWAWLDWIDLLSERLGIEQVFQLSVRLSIKRLMLNETNPKNTTEELASLKDNEPIFKINATQIVNTNEYDAVDLGTPESPKLIFDGMMNWWEFRTNQHGYLQNMSDKKERLTSGENFKDLKAISNIQAHILNQLKKFGTKFTKKYPHIQLNFNVGEWGEPEPQEFGSRGSSHPSMDMSFNTRHQLLNKKAFNQ